MKKHATNNMNDMNSSNETIARGPRCESTNQQQPIPSSGCRSRKEGILNLRRACLISLACVLLAGCGSQPKDLILGKWQAADNTGDTVEFSEEGAVNFVVAGGRSIGGHYKFEEKSVIEISWDSPIQHDSGFQEMKVLQFPKITKDKLVIKDPNGQSKTYKRAQ